MKSLCIIAMLSLFSISCMDADLNNTPVYSLSLDRYLGDWYEIARFDHSFEKGMTHAKASYTMNKDGTITVINSGIKNNKYKSSKGKAKLTGTTGILKVSFFWPFYSEYRILMLDQDYRFALVGSKSDDYLWILSRTPQMDKRDIGNVLYEASKRGYDIDDLIWVQQDCTM